MGDRVDELLRGETDVDRVQDGADHGNGEEALQVAVAVPVHHGHRITRLDSDFSKSRGEPADPLLELPVGEAQRPAIDDFLVGIVYHGPEHEILDQEGVAVGGFSFENEILHCVSSG